MKIPKKLKAGGHIYNISLVNGESELANKQWLGKTAISDCKMVLDKSLPQSKLEETFLHEILHICFDLAGIDRSDEKEEFLVNSLSNQLYPILKGNNLLK